MGIPSGNRWRQVCFVHSTGQFIFDTFSSAETKNVRIFDSRVAFSRTVAVTSQDAEKTSPASALIGDHSSISAYRSANHYRAISATQSIVREALLLLWAVSRAASISECCRIHEKKSLKLAFFMDSLEFHFQNERRILHRFGAKRLMMMRWHLILIFYV